jgi:hypothetical protein
MKNSIVFIVKLINGLLAFASCVYLISKSYLLFPLLIAAFTTYLNVKIDEVFEGAD